ILGGGRLVSMFLVAWRMWGVLVADVWPVPWPPRSLCRRSGTGFDWSGDRLWECGQAVEAAARSVAHGQARCLGSTGGARQAAAPAGRSGRLRRAAGLI